MSTSAPQSTTVRRIVTGHTSDGKAVVWKDEEVNFMDVRTTAASQNAARFAHLWTTDASPWNNLDERDLAQNEDSNKLSNRTGSVLRVVDLPPNRAGPFHRTVSLDYGILTSGECYLVLDDGKEVHMKQGDVCVQRGTVHGWRTTDGWARFYFVLLAAEPIQFEGKALGDEGFHLVKDK